MSMTPYTGSTGNDDQADASTRVLQTQGGGMGSTGSKGSTGTGNTGDSMQNIGDKAGDVVNQTQQKAGEVVDQVKQQASSQFDTQKGRAAEALGSVALAIRQTGTQLHDQENTQVAQYADKAAEQVERLSTYLRETDLNNVVRGVERYARRQPALFIGGALALGLLGARFLKSSSQQSQNQDWGGYGYYRGDTSDYSRGSMGGYSYSGSSTAHNPYIGRSYGSNYDAQGYDQGSSGGQGAYSEDGGSEGGSRARERTWTGTSLEES